MRPIVREDVQEDLEALLVELFESQEDYDLFSEWAYGHKLELDDDPIGLWNDLHSHLLVLEHAGNVFEDVPIMVTYWVAEKLKRERASSRN